MKEHNLRLLGNRLIMRIFGPEREEVTNGYGRKFHEEELHYLCFSPNIIRKTRWTGQDSHMGEKRIQGFGGET
jgi:hypothetical protein